LVGLGLVTAEPRQLRRWSALVAVVLLIIELAARIKAKMGVRLPASLMAFIAFGSFGRIRSVSVTPRLRLSHV
jgi:hypothetical protein